MHSFENPYSKEPQKGDFKDYYFYLAEKGGSQRYTSQDKAGNLVTVEVSATPFKTLHARSTRNNDTYSLEFTINSDNGKISLYTNGAHTLYVPNDIKHIMEQTISMHLDILEQKHKNDARDSFGAEMRNPDNYVNEEDDETSY
jgi:hypothetical protein